MYTVLDKNNLKIDLWGGYSRYEKNTETLYVSRPYGLFSNITITLYGILRLFSDGYPVKNLSIILEEYFDRVNVYDLLFFKNLTNLNLEKYSKEELEHSLKYGEPNYLGLGRCKSDLNTELYHNILTSYFNFLDIENFITNILTKYSIDLDNSTFIWARKTDKVQEISIPTLNSYLDIINQQKLHKTQILLQTDDITIKNEVLNISNILLLNELPYSNNNGFHNNLNKVTDEEFYEKYNISKLEYIKILLALVTIASRSKYCIIYPGNLSTFIPILKNTFHNCFMFKDEKTFIS